MAVDARRRVPLGRHRRRAGRGRRRDQRRALHQCASRQANSCPPTRTSSRSRATSPFVLRPLSVPCPVYPAKGLFGDDRDRRSSRRADGVAHRCRREDRDHASLASRLRVAGTAELSGYGTDLNAIRCEALVKRTSSCSPTPASATARSSGPGCGRRRRRTFRWSARPAIGNLFLDTGHGTLGWTMACGSGSALADIIGGRRPEVEFAFT